MGIQNTSVTRFFLGNSLGNFLMGNFSTGGYSPAKKSDLDQNVYPKVADQINILTSPGGCAEHTQIRTYE